MEDELNDMGKALEQLAEHGHASGEFIRLDNVSDVIYRNSHTVYLGIRKKAGVNESCNLTSEQRADILMNGTVRV